MSERWEVGQIIARREILGFEPTGTADPNESWFGLSWLDLPARVVQDNDQALVLYIAPGTPITLPEHDWPAAGGLHPWHDKQAWHGAGCLMWHQPEQHHAIWHFWSDTTDRAFQYWYINLQMSYRRRGAVLETQDLELDYLVSPNRSWQVKDWEVLDDRVVDGRYTPELVDWIRDYGNSLSERLDRGDFWWDESWANWTPPPEWEDGASLRLPE